MKSLLVMYWPYQGCSVRLRITGRPLRKKGQNSISYHFFQMEPICILVPVCYTSISLYVSRTAMLVSHICTEKPHLHTSTCLLYEYMFHIHGADIFFFFFQIYLYRVDHSVRLFFHGALLQNKIYIQKMTYTYTHTKLEIVDQWSTRIPPPHRRGWHCSKSQGSHFESDIADNR